jgi:hypothetical protein
MEILRLVQRPICRLHDISATRVLASMKAPNSCGEISGRSGVPFGTTKPYQASAPGFDRGWKSKLADG